MASPDVVAPALLLSITLVSLSMSVYNWLVHRSNPINGAVLLLLAVLSAVSGGIALSVACGEPLRVVAKVFTNLLHATLSGVSIYALGPSSQAPAFPPLFLRFFLSLAGLLVACELISALIPTSPLLLPALFALVSRSILLALAITAAVLLGYRHAAVSTEANMEKDRPPNESFGKTLSRVSSPTQATWPFPGSLAIQDQPKRAGLPANKSTPLTRTDITDDCSCKMGRRVLTFLPLVLMIAQMFATISAALNVAASAFVGSATSQTSPPQSHILLASAACMLLWSLMILTTIQILPITLRPYPSEKQAATSYEQRPLGGDSAKFSRDHPVTRTPKPSLSRRESDSLLEFLSLRDPFASSPPPPPPLPPVGLGLDEVDVGWNGSKEIGMQYRFPAPRSIVKGGRRKGKMAHISRQKCLVHQDSARMLLPVPETRGTEADTAGEKEFGDEARLAQLLLQSLSEGGEDPDGLAPPTPAPTVQPPQVAHVQQTSRWSTSTTVQSIMSASVSNRSGVSTYTTCASEKVPTSRFSVNTIVSALGSRKSVEARRKSVNASSSKG